MREYVRDEIPRMLAYPVEFVELKLGFEAEDDLLEGTGVFFLYTSADQVEYYDPLTSKEKIYPILAVDHGTPDLAGATIARLAEIHQKREPEAGRREVDDLVGSERADAQLAGTFRAESDAQAEEEKTRRVTHLELCATSILVFPVKRRIQARVSRAMEATGFRYLRNWLFAPQERRDSQRPLVLLFDETQNRVTGKFVEKEIDPSVSRVYC